MKISSDLSEELPKLSLGGALLILGGRQQTLVGNCGDNLGLGFRQTCNSERLTVLLSS